MVERHRRRLARAFRVAILAACGPAAAASCAGTNAAKNDAGSREDAGGKGGKGDAALDAGQGPDVYALGGCFINAVELVGPDGESPAFDTCLYRYGCGLPNRLVTNGCSVRQREDDGGLVPLPGILCWIPEEAGCTNDVFTPAEGGALTMACTPCPQGGGRRPAGLARAARPGAATAAGAYLAAMAFEERAAIAAFARMRAELQVLGAPRRLVRGAAAAERDEQRHARSMARLATARGARCATPRVRSRGRRDAVAIALENAAEGCVRETYGALTLAWQAERARDGELREAFARMARDEARHAALSWALGEWLDPRLDAAGRARVRRAKARAVARLARELAQPPPSLVAEAGLPTAAQARALLGALTRELGLAPAAARNASLRADTAARRPA